jgi:hypothetical protein
VINIEDDNEAEFTSDDISKYEIDPTVKAVVAGFNSTLTYKKLCIATLYIQ